MRTVRTKVYKFSELSKQAKDRAIERFREMEDCQFIMDEAEGSLTRFCKIFDIKLIQFEPQEMHRSEWRFHIDDNISELTGQRLATWIWNNYRSYIFKGKYYGKLVYTFKDGTPIPKSNEHPIGARHVKRYSKCQLSRDCVLTGICYDMDVLAPIYEFLDKPKDLNFETLLSDCLYSLGHSVSMEIDHALSDEGITESIELNEYEFTKEGNLF